LTVPRSPGGDTSDKYSGTICDDAPTPTPVMSRPNRRDARTHGALCRDVRL